MESILGCRMMQVLNYVIRYELTNMSQRNVFKFKPFEYIATTTGSPLQEQEREHMGLIIASSFILLR